jgi:hypothetical protein
MVTGIGATQNVSRKPLPITPLHQVVPGVRTPTLPNSRLVNHIRLVVRDGESWFKLLSQMTGLDPRSQLSDFPELLEVDFSREMLVVAAMGQQPSSGYSIIIEAMFENDEYDRCEIVVRSINRTKCNGVATVLTSPVDIVRVPRSDCKIVFSEKQDWSCEPLYSPTTPKLVGRSVKETLISL